jgi:alpha-tubulin suppressor-like RCC1 family protein
MPGVDSVRNPAGAEWLKDIALRDLTLQERHAACVDAKGDVYQWGAGFSPSFTEPTITLRNKVRIYSPPSHICPDQLVLYVRRTSPRLLPLPLASSRFLTRARSTSFPHPLTRRSCPRGNRHQRAAPGLASLAAIARQSTSWSFLQTLRLAGVKSTPLTSFALTRYHANIYVFSRFVELKAGAHHLLARTSSGRTFAHPLSPLANTHGQLGLRTITIPSTSATTSPASASSNTRTDLELAPIASQRSRNTAPPLRIRALGEAAKPAVPDDIRWCDQLFELPALRGVNVAQVATGARSSFVRTADGHVLGWGANEYG